MVEGARVPLATARQQVSLSFEMGNVKFSRRPIKVAHDSGNERLNLNLAQRCLYPIRQIKSDSSLQSRRPSLEGSENERSEHVKPGLDQMYILAVSICESYATGCRAAS